MNKKDLHKELKLYTLRGLNGCTCNLSDDKKKAYTKYKNIKEKLFNEKILKEITI